MDSKKTGQGGVGFLGLLALLFIGLKLGGAIDWSWWWILCPLWIPFALVFIVAFVLSLWDALNKPRFK